MSKDRAIIFITKNTLQTFKVVDEQYEALNSKGIMYISYSSESDLNDYVEVLKTKYNIDDFSEIDISFSIINLGAEGKFITILKTLLDGAEKIDVNNVEKLIPLILASKGEIKTNTALQEEYNSLLSKANKLESENKSLIELNDKQDCEIAKLNSQLNFIINEIESIKNKKIEKERLRKEKEQTEKELSESIYKIDFLKDAENSGISLFIPKGKEVVFSKLYRNGDNVSKGAAIASYYTGIHWNEKIFILAKKSGRIYYMVNDNASVKNGNVVAVIGDFNTKDEAKEWIWRIHYDTTN